MGKQRIKRRFLACSLVCLVVCLLECLFVCLFVLRLRAILNNQALYLHQHLLCSCCDISYEDGTAPLPWDSQQDRLPHPAATKHTSHSLCLLPLMCCCSTPTQPIEAAIVTNSTELSKKLCSNNCVLFCVKYKRTVLRGRL